MSDTKTGIAEGLDIRSHDPTWRTFNKYKMKRFAGQKITLPFGVQIPASLFANVRPPGSDDSYILHSADKILKQAKPGCRYIWRLRADEDTIGMVEVQDIRPVRIDEIIRNHNTAKVIAYMGPSPDKKSVVEYVGWKRYALFEVGPELAYQWFQHPEDYALGKLAGLGAAFENDVAEKSHGKMEGRFEVKDRGKN